MWEAIGDAIASENGMSIAVLAVLTFISVFVGLKHGRIKLKTDRLTIEGEARDKERLLMKKQSECASVACKGFEKRIARFDGYNTLLGALIAEKAYDQIVEWIMANHIRDDQEYITDKQEIIWDIVSAEVVDDRFRSEKFKKQVYECIEHIIRRLVQIRENEQKEE